MDEGEGEKTSAPQSKFVHHPAVEDETIGVVQLRHRLDLFLSAPGLGESHRVLRGGGEDVRDVLPFGDQGHLRIEFHGDIGRDPGGTDGILGNKVMAWAMRSRYS